MYSKFRTLKFTLAGPACRFLSSAHVTEDTSPDGRLKCFTERPVWCFAELIEGRQPFSRDLRGDGIYLSNSHNVTGTFWRAACINTIDFLTFPKFSISLQNIPLRDHSFQFPEISAIYDWDERPSVHIPKRHLQGVIRMQKRHMAVIQQ